MTREWKPGDVAAFRSGDEDFVGIYVEGECLLGCSVGRSGAAHWHSRGGAMSASFGWRPLVVIDPEDRETVARLLFAYNTATEDASFDAMQAALRSLIGPPKPYRDHAGPMAPWPGVSECHSSRLPDHECPQCAWEHEHDWVAWNRHGNVSEVPVRCSKCGGRKCDRDDCDQRRHTHTHHDEATS